MGVVATKLQEAKMAKSTSTTTQVVKKDERSNCKIKVKKPQATQRCYQGFVKRLFPITPQEPLDKVKKGRNPLTFSHFYWLNEKIKKDVQEQDEKSEDSTTSTSSDDME